MCMSCEWCCRCSTFDRKKPSARSYRATVSFKAISSTDLGQIDFGWPATILFDSIVNECITCAEPRHSNTNTLMQFSGGDQVKCSIAPVPIAIPFVVPTRPRLLLLIPHGGQALLCHCFIYLQFRASFVFLVADLCSHLFVCLLWLSVLWFRCRRADACRCVNAELMRKCPAKLLLANWPGILLVGTNIAFH